MNDYSVGTYLIDKDNKRKEITEVGSTHLVLKDPFIQDSQTVSRAAIDEKIFLGDFSVVTFDERSQQLKKPLTKDFASFSDDDKRIAARRLGYVEKVRSADLKGLTEKRIAPIVDELAREIGEHPPSWRTIVRWVKWYEASGITGLVDQSSRKGNRTRRTSTEIDSYIKNALSTLLKKEKPTIAKAYEYFKTDLIQENAKRASSNKIEIISYQSFAKRAKTLSEYEKLLHHKGKQQASKQYRLTRVSALSKSVDYILDCVEIDHTTVDLFVVDDKLRIPLGRPRITCIIDWKSKSILGFYIGFEDPSYISIAKAIKMAVSDKRKLLQDYPEIKNDWPCKGVFKSISYDRGRDFESNFLKDALLELQVSGNANPAGKPWNKGSIESFFNTLNKKFLIDIPGKVFANMSESSDYHSEKNAVITLSELRAHFLKWIVDIYQVSPNSTATRIPNETWAEDEQFVGIRMIDERKLDLMLCENKVRTLSQKGIMNEGLIYDSEELLRLSMLGFKKVRIKVNRDDLGYIYVLDEDKGEYFRVNAVNQTIASGVSVKQHEMAKQYVRQQIRAKVDDESIAQAWSEIHERIEASIFETKSVTRRFKQAQLAGAGRDGKSGSLLQPPKATKTKGKNQTVGSLLDETPVIKTLPKDLES
ncbi:Mu transposase C-terminal domain-containing protein [Idiomarina sp. ST20R2A10]|uniref:Mu transposase C-terminal domain-containing protein n=1 Tax=Idiomarina sp. ST20R2A10 TaxID=3418369 RepID=UPI003EC4B87B